MIYKLRTSSRTQEIFAKVGQTSGLPAFALSKIAISLSLRKGKLTENDYHTDNYGLELNRQTIFGDTELLFRCLMICLEDREIPPDEFFPKTVKAHLDRGAKLLENEVKYSNNLFTHLCQLDSTI